MTHPAPYAGLEDRELKVYSDEEIRALEEGEGMGYALVAELSHHPGPKHALELRVELALDSEQVLLLERIFAEMHASASRLGRELLEGERKLQDVFEGEDPGAARELVAAIATIEGELRWSHLEAHLLTRSALTEAQVRRYDELRGYARETAPAAGTSSEGTRERSAPQF